MASISSLESIIGQIICDGSGFAPTAFARIQHLFDFSFLIAKHIGFDGYTPALALIYAGNMDKDTVVLVTGVSSGIGLELARKLIHRPYRLVLTARESSLPLLREAGIVAGPRVRLEPLDVTNFDAMHTLIDTIEREWDGVDILINNAGISYRSVVEDMTDEDEWQQLATNYLGPMCLIRSVLPRMRRLRAGRIINVSSVGGMMAMPTMASYSASKFALEGASEALWYELRPFGIHVTTIQPGFIHSESFRRVISSRRRQARLMRQETSVYDVTYDKMEAFVGFMMEHSPQTAEDIAELILHTMRRRRPPLRVPGTFDAHLFSWLRRLLPRSLYHEMLYRLLPGIRAWGKEPGGPTAGPQD